LILHRKNTSRQDAKTPRKNENKTSRTYRAKVVPAALLHVRHPWGSDVGRSDFTDVIGRVESGTEIENKARSSYRDVGNADSVSNGYLPRGTRGREDKISLQMMKRAGQEGVFLSVVRVSAVK
jgi:hypothetical protein